MGKYNLSTGPIAGLAYLKKSRKLVPPFPQATSDVAPRFFCYLSGLHTTTNINLEILEGRGILVSDPTLSAEMSY